MAEGKSSAPNIQDVFLNYARREKLAVTVHLLDGREFEAPHQELRSLRRDPRARRPRSPGVQARHRHPAGAAQRAQLLLVAPSLIASAPQATPPRWPPARSSSCSTAWAPARCPMPPPTATRAATRSATSRRARPLRFRRWPPSACRRAVPLPGVPVPAAPRAAWGRMAERSPGKDSVTGHWELMGLVLDRPFPTFPHGFPGRAHRRVRAPASAGRCSATSSPRARPSSTQLGDEHCAPATRSSTPRPTASSRSPRTKPSCRSPSSTTGAAPPTSWRSRALGLGRVIARPFVGTPGAYVRTANRHDFAMPPPRETLLDRLTARRRAGHGGGEGRRPLRRPRHQHVASDRQRRRGPRRARGRARRAPAAGCCSSTSSTSTRSYGHRNDVAGLRRQPRAVRRPARATSCAALRRRRPARHHRRPRQRSDDAEHRPLARVRAAAGARRPRLRRGRRPRHPRHLRRPRADAGRVVRRGAAGARHELSRPRCAERGAAATMDACRPAADRA